MQKQVVIDLIMQNSQLYVKSEALFIAGTTSIQYNIQTVVCKVRNSQGTSSRTQESSPDYAKRSNSLETFSRGKVLSQLTSFIRMISFCRINLLSRSTTPDR